MQIHLIWWLLACQTCYNIRTVSMPLLCATFICLVYSLRNTQKLNDMVIVISADQCLHLYWSVQDINVTKLSTFLVLTTSFCSDIICCTLHFTTYMYIHALLYMCFISWYILRWFYIIACMGHNVGTIFWQVDFASKPSHNALVVILYKNNEGDLQLYFCVGYCIYALDASTLQQNVEIQIMPDLMIHPLFALT